MMRERLARGPAAGVVVRDACAADMPSVTALYAYEVLERTATFELIPPDLAEMTARWRAVLDAGLYYLVAEADGAVLGYGYVGPFRTRPAYRFTVEDSIYVAPHAQGRGVGSALLGALIDRSEADGRRQMLAVIGDSANAASIRLHAAAGFERVGQFSNVGWKLGGWRDVVLMQRALGEGGGSPPAPEA